MSDLVRVKLVDADDKGADSVRYATVGAEFAANLGLEVVKDMDAVDNRGTALDFKPHTSVDEAATKKATTATNKSGDAK